MGCARLRCAVIRSKSGQIRQFSGLDPPRFSKVSGDRIFLATEKTESGKKRFLTRDGHVAFHRTRYSRICPYSRGIRVRIVGYLH